LDLLSSGATQRLIKTWYQITVAIKDSTGATIRRFAPAYLAETSGNRGNVRLHRYIATMYRFREALAFSVPLSDGSGVADSRFIGTA
jgi:hypothetical protein